MPLSPVSPPADTPDAAPLHIALLGGFAVTVGGVPLRKLRTRQGNRLLALLALRHGRDVERARLAVLLWPESKSETAGLALLRRTLTDVRAALGAESARLQSPSQGSLRLNVNGAFLDVREFDLAVAAGTRPDLDRALALYHGPLMPDLDAENDPDGGVQNARERLHHQFLSALEQRAALLHQEGDVARAIADVRRLLIADPLRESAVQQLMELLGETGDRAGARAEYLQFKERLASQLGDDALPEPPLRRLFARLQTSDAQPDRLTPALPPAPVGAVTGLPVPLTRFFGREADLQRLRDWISGPEKTQRRRLITITGPPGMGKTRLAVEFARSHAERGMGKRGWFVPLAEAQTPEQGKAALGRILGLKGGQAGDIDAIVAALCGTDAEPPGLLVLDNAEHLLAPPDTGDTSDENDVAFWVRQLLTRCPDLTCLVTSRRPLLLSGEQELPLASLFVPDAEDSVSPPLLGDTPSIGDAAALFEDRANLANPDFVPDTADRRAIAALCRKLDGVPLALEMAAAGMRGGTVAEIVAQVSRRMEHLAFAQRDLPLRQRSVAAAVAWSYDLLALPVRTVFEGLSVFENGWTLDAARVVCAADAESLRELVRASLVVAAPGAEAAGDRYRFLEIVRAYAGEKLRESGQEATLRHQHAQYFLHKAQDYALLRSPASYPAGALLEPERGNFLRAFGTLSHAPNRSRDAFRLAQGLGLFYLNRGPNAEGRALLSAALSAAPTPQKNDDGEYVRLWATVLLHSGLFALRERDMEAADGLFEQAAAWYAQRNDEAGIADALQRRSFVACETGRFDDAAGFAARARKHARHSGSSALIAATLGMSANIAMRQNDFALARRLHEESIVLERAENTVNALASSLADLGLVCCDMHDWEAARVALAESVALCQANGLNHVFLLTLEGCALRADGLGEVFLSARLYAALHHLQRSIGVTQPLAVETSRQEIASRHQVTLGETAYAQACTQGAGWGWDAAKKAAANSLCSA